MKKILCLLLCFIVVACSSSKPDKRDKTHAPLHGGIILKGKKYFLEIVAKDRKHVELYPLVETDPENKTLGPIDMKRVKLNAEYSPKHSKQDWSLNLRKKADHYAGTLKHQDEEAFQIYVDMKVDKDKEDFIYVVKPKAQ